MKLVKLTLSVLALTAASTVRLTGVFLFANAVSAAAPWETSVQVSNEVSPISGGTHSQETGNGGSTSTSATRGSLADASAALESTRILHFPEDRSLGKLSIQTGPMERYPLNMEFSAFARWEYIGQAIGSVSVPAGKRIMLQTDKSALGDLSPLSSLGPNDLQQLEINADGVAFGNPDETIMPHLQRLTGLESLSLMYVDVTAEGLRYLAPLRSLTHLLIAPSSTFIPIDAVSSSRDMGDAGVAELAKLTSLEVLSLYSREVTDDGVAHLATLPSLRQLRLCCRKVRGPGLAHLAKLPALECLAMKNVKIGDQGVTYLKDCVRLRRLELDRVGLTDGGFGALLGYDASGGVVAGGERHHRAWVPLPHTHAAAQAP